MVCFSLFNKFAPRFCSQNQSILRGIAKSAEKFGRGKTFPAGRNDVDVQKSRISERGKAVVQRLRFVSHRLQIVGDELGEWRIF